MEICITRAALIVSLVICGRLAIVPAIAADQDPINAPPTVQDWQALAKLPDWGGVRGGGVGLEPDRGPAVRQRGGRRDRRCRGGGRSWPLVAVRPAPAGPGD